MKARVVIVLVCILGSIVSGYSQKVYSCEYKSDADVKVYVAAYKSDADWKKKTKMHLMY